jgi:hypothetical protein
MLIPKRLEDIYINKYFFLLIIVFAILGWVLADGEEKAQYVRLVDVFLYGPYLVYIAFKKKYIFSNLEKIFLLFLGITTITYNARNMLKIK